MANDLTVSRRQQRVQSRIQPLRSTRLTVYMTESEADALDEAAQTRGTPLSAFLRRRTMIGQRLAAYGSPVTYTCRIR